MEVKKVSDNLVEVSSVSGYDEEYFDGGMPLEGELEGSNNFRYYIIGDNNSMQEIASNRTHPETEFVKLDNSYISGDFRLYKGDELGWQKLSVYPAFFLQRMRNEILAVYGLSFENPADQEYFERFKWYTPRFNSESEIQDVLSENDKHNLAFLANAINAQGPVSL